MPAVSVIIPNYNHAAYLQQRIETVIGQTFRDFELILLDDGSTDGSRQIMERYRGHEKVKHIIFNNKNSGSTYKQWERGIALAQGRYCWIAESDDWAEPDFLAEMLYVIGNNKNIGIAFCNSDWVNSEGTTGKSLSLDTNSFYRNGKEEIRSRLLRNNTIQNASAALLKTDLLRNFVAVAKSYKACGDWYIYIQMLATSDIVFNEKKMNYFRWYTNNVSNAASKKGLWITEGISILSDSKQILSGLSRNELQDLSAYWREKVKTLATLQSFYWKWKLHHTFSQVLNGRDKNVAQYNA